MEQQDGPLPPPPLPLLYRDYISRQKILNERCALSYIWQARTWSCASPGPRPSSPARGRPPSHRECPIRRRRSSPTCPNGKSPRCLNGSIRNWIESIKNEKIENEKKKTFVFTEAVDDADHAFQSAVLLQVVLDQFGLVRSVSALAASPFPGGTLPLLLLWLSLLSPL